MIKEKKIWLIILIVFTLIVVLIGCNGLPKTAKINISITPNPVPYDSENEYWPFDVIFSESNGIGITLISLRFDSYDQTDELVDTEIFYEEDITDWFDSNYLPAFSSLSSKLWYTGGKKYAIITISGIDDSDNPIEATSRIDFLPQ